MRSDYERWLKVIPIAVRNTNFLNIAATGTEKKRDAGISVVKTYAVVPQYKYVEIYGYVIVHH